MQDAISGTNLLLCGRFQQNPFSSFGGDASGTDKHTDGQTDIHTYIQTDRQAGRQADRQQRHCNSRSVGWTCAVGGLSKDDLGVLKEAHIAAIPQSAIPLIPPTQFNVSIRLHYWSERWIIQMLIVIIIICFIGIPFHTSISENCHCRQRFYNILHCREILKYLCTTFMFLSDLPNVCHTPK